VCQFMQKFDFDNAVCSFGCRIYELFCAFVNFVMHFDKTRLVCKIVC